MKFEKSRLYDELTIIMVCRNWVSLHYPFIEAIWSTMPLGCRFLIGMFDTTDNTIDYINALREFVPIDIYQGQWHYECRLGAIGVATHDVWQQAATPARFNLQANEILTDGGADSIKAYFDQYWPSPVSDTVHGGVYFRHFWGNFSFEGARAGGAYTGPIRRIGNKDDDYRRGSGDGCYPYPSDSGDTGAWIHRYSYCFDNQIVAKVRNHTQILLSRNAEQHIKEIRGYRNKPNYTDAHPSYVQHLKDKLNYNIDESLQVFRAAMSVQ